MGSCDSRVRRFVLSWAALLGLLCAASPAGASVMRFLQVEELARASTLVARARILSAESRWTDGNQGIVTEVRAVLLGTLSAKGTPPPDGRVVTILQAGGEVDGVRLDWVGRPEFRPGEDLVLFLQPYEPADAADSRLIVVGGRQGRMRVLPRASGGSGPPLMVERDLFGVIDAPQLEGVEPTGPGVRHDLIPWDELQQRARAGGGGR